MHHFMWIDPLLTLELILKGLIVGIVASAPMGPVGVLTVQRTLNKGRWYGFVTGVGAALSDIIYAVVTGLGLSLVMDFVEKGTAMLWIKLAGGVMLFLFGLWTFKTKPAPLRPKSNQKGTFAHNFLTGFLVTLSNPLIVFLFLALFARFEFVTSGHPVEQILGYLAIVAGALGWWFGLTGTVDKVRSRFRVETVWKLNKAIGIAVMLATLIGLLFIATQK